MGNWESTSSLHQEKPAQHKNELRLEVHCYLCLRWGNELRVVSTSDTNMNCPVFWNPVTNPSGASSACLFSFCLPSQMQSNSNHFPGLQASNIWFIGILERHTWIKSNEADWQIQVATEPCCRLRAFIHPLPPPRARSTPTRIVLLQEHHYL